MRRYDDCQYQDKSRCAECSLCSYGHDCHNAPVNNLAYLRSLNGMTQTALAKASGVHAMQISKIERGVYKLDNIALASAAALAAALGVHAEDLL